MEFRSVEHRTLRRQAKYLVGVLRFPVGRRAACCLLVRGCQVRVQGAVQAFQGRPRPNLVPALAG